jgi:hypothetical protein
MREMDYIEFKILKAIALLAIIFVVAIGLGYKEGLLRAKNGRRPLE